MLAANAASYAAYSAPNAPPPTKAYLERARASVDEPASRKGAGTSRTWRNLQSTAKDP